MAKDPLEGKTLVVILNELFENYGWQGLGAEIAINCFTNQPSINSSLKFLRKNPWARAKVERLYLDLEWRRRRAAESANSTPV